MRVLLLLAFVLTWVSCCIGCGPRPPASPPTSRELAAQLEAETVALITKRDDGSFRSYCAGVWISETEFVTAGHCVEDLGKPESQTFAEQLAQVFGLPAPSTWSPIGQPAEFSLQNEASEHRIGDVVAYDAERDLGLVRAESFPPHAFASIRLGPISDGDHVEFVGHPLGHTWSYGEGYVSNSRAAGHGPVLQIAGPFTFGNSGGGAFDTRGRLLGIASFLIEGWDGEGFFIHRDSVLEFLRKAGAE